jgi:hypothetical protein
METQSGLKGFIEKHKYKMENKQSQLKILKIYNSYF